MNLSAPLKSYSLLNRQEKIFRRQEIILRAISEKKALSSSPAKLNVKSDALRCFTPRVNEKGFSVIHEDTRNEPEIVAIARSINPNRSLKALVKTNIETIEKIATDNPNDTYLHFNVIRDDEGYEGHAQILPMPADPDQADLRSKVGAQLHKAFFYGDTIEVKN